MSIRASQTLRRAAAGVLLLSLGCTPLTAPENDEAQLTQNAEPEETAQSADTIDFETLPDGSPICGGAARCPISDEYSSLGLRLVGSAAHENCAGEPTWRVQSTYVYDAPGAAANRAASNVCSVGTYGMELSTGPTRLSFEVTMNASVDIEITGFDASGQALSSSAITRSPSVYVTRGDHEFRRELVTVESEAGVASVWWDTHYFGVILDNVILGG